MKLHREIALCFAPEIALEESQNIVGKTTK